MHFTAKTIKETSSLPETELISSVFLFAVKGHTIVATKHKERGWDSPGGHLEKDEAPLEALRREAMEEAGITFQSASPFVVIENDVTDREEKYFGKVMVGYVTKEYRLVDFVPAEDVSERAVMDIDDFISNYEGDKESLKSILEHIDK